jgi:hypothetical protein
VGNPKEKESTPASYTPTTHSESTPASYTPTPKKKSPKKKSPKKVAQKLIDKFPFGKKKSPKKSPKKSSKKSMMVRIPLEKLRNVTPVKKTRTLADLKMGLAQKKMERAMRGPIGSSRTSDTGGFTLGKRNPFHPFRGIDT